MGTGRNKMKTVVIADIHGSYDSIKQLEIILAKENAQKLIILGDILYHGPRNPLPEGYNPKAVAEWLNQLAIPCLAVQGNCDSEVDQMVLDMTIHPGHLDMASMILTHGHHLDELVATKKWIFHGHTHVPVIDCDKRIYNPGSITLPKEGHPRTYGLLIEQELLIKTLDGEVYMKESFISEGI